MCVATRATFWRGGAAELTCPAACTLCFRGRSFPSLGAETTLSCGCGCGGREKAKECHVRPLILPSPTRTPLRFYTGWNQTWGWRSAAQPSVKERRGQAEPRAHAGLFYSLSASSPGFIDFCEKGPFIASTRAWTHVSVAAQNEEADKCRVGLGWRGITYMEGPILWSRWGLYISSLDSSGIICYQETIRDIIIIIIIMWHHLGPICSTVCWSNSLEL